MRPTWRPNESIMKAARCEQGHRQGQGPGEIMKYAEHIRRAIDAYLKKESK